MHAHTPLMRLGVLLATTSLTFAPLLQAAAQPAPPDGQPPGAEQAGDPNTNPPALAGRVAAITGSVSFHSAGETQWSAATLNYPVTNGAAFWTEPQAQASLEVADDRIVMDSATELDVGVVDTSQITMTEAQGAIFMQLNSLQPNQSVTFNTPRGAVQITAPGRYEIVAGDTNDATMITVVDGAAHVTGTDLALDVGPQQTATIGGTDTLQGTVSGIQQDAFLASMLRPPVRRHSVAAAPPQVRYMTGAADLESYGSYSQSAQYGQVWYPNDVSRNWAPYRDGHWAYVQPWGWTWVDNARWGFAPFHYGRWVQVQDRWGWVAGGGEVQEESAYPVYSPALVSFVDVGVGAVGASIGFGAGGYSPAWIPLGPREPYYPWYHCRTDYFDRVNRPYGVPRTVIERGPTYINDIHNTTIVNNVRVNQVFINQRGATVVPAGAFTRGQSLASFARPVPAAAFAHARPFVGRLAVAPTAETPNLPQAAARRYNVALPARPVGRVLPGPRIEAAQAGPGRAPALRQAAPPPGIHAVPAAQIRTGQPPVAGNPVRGEPRAAAPGLPALRGPGARPGQPGAAGPGAQPGAQGGGRPERAGTPIPGARPAAPGPQIGPRAKGGLPGLRAPGARPGPGLRQPAEAARQQQPSIVRPGQPALQPPRESVAPVLPQVNRPAATGAGPVPHLNPVARTPEAPRPAASRAEPVRPAPRVERPAPRVEAPRPVPRVEAPRPMPRVEAPRAAPRTEAPRPQPRMEAPRPQPRMEAPRPQPRMEAPRPQPRMEAPRPQPRVEAPRSQPRMEAPRPPPRAEPQRPAPQPHPAAPGPHRPDPHM